MLRIFREVEQSGEELIVTDNNRPVLKIQPLTKKKAVDEIFSDVRGKVTYHEDINTPTDEECDAL
jgi:antitoxin (DNA-binding transcriptional repressor) of toxin-antitoxin stability system